MNLSLSFCERHSKQARTAARRRSRVRNGRTNFELHLRAGLALTPDFQVGANQFGALAHARQAKVSGAGFSIQHLRVDALSIVANTQSKLPLAIADSHLDPAPLRMAKSVAQGLPG